VNTSWQRLSASGGGGGEADHALLGNDGHLIQSSNVPV